MSTDKDSFNPSDGRTGVRDAAADNWVDRYAPTGLRPYLRLARLDRPIGTWLLLWPCWWSLALGAPGSGAPTLTVLWYFLLFAVGATAMRGAGCTFNDIVDKDFDARVARTAHRPVASGQVSVRQAWAFLILQSLVGLLVLIQFNLLTIGLGVASLALVAVYPFMKRLTYWPQAWLGLAFNWGALMGWAALQGGLAWPPVLLYLAGIAWTLGYDTIYAHQDKEDDALIGVKSTALKLGAATKIWMWGFYGAFLFMLIGAGAAAGLGPFYYAGIALAALHCVWQIRSLDIDDPGKCLTLFRANRDTGALVFASFVLGWI